MALVLIPFGVFAVFSATVIWLIQRNIRRSTRMHGVVTGKRFSPAHGNLAASGNRGERVVVVPDSWVLDVEDGRHHGHAVVSEAEFDSVQIGDEYDGGPEPSDPRWDDDDPSPTLF